MGTCVGMSAGAAAWCLPGLAGAFQAPWHAGGLLIAGRLALQHFTCPALLLSDAFLSFLLPHVPMRRLGVKQRERLTHGLEAPPHMLLMTATPIPRTLAILQYGGLAFSTIRELPPGRTPVETHVVQDEEEGRQLVRV